MFKCLKDGRPADVEFMNPKALGIPNNYWLYIDRHLAESNYIEGVACVNQRRAHYMEDVKVKGCPDPPTLEECLEELEKTAIKMMNGE